MNSILNEPEPDVWPHVAPLLDEAVAQLGTADRDAVVLRYYQQKPLEEVGHVLGLNADAAQKRVSRALDKLRRFFIRRGVESTTDAIAGAISANSIQTPPKLLTHSVTVAALAKGGTASLAAVTLAKATLIAMKTKAITTAAVAALVVGSGAYVIYHLVAAQASATPTKAADLSPITFANTDFKPDGDRNGTFIVEVDPNTRRTTNSAPAMHIQGPIQPDLSDSTRNGFYQKTDNSISTKYFVVNSALYGKRVRITGWLKTKDARGWGSAFVIVLGVTGRHMQYDDMSDRPIRGTTDWQQIEIVTDLPKEMCIIYFGPDLYGPGELWADDFQIDLAPLGTPTTDDRNWRISNESGGPVFYAVTADNSVTHDGHPAICITYTPSAPPPSGTYTRFLHDFYGADSDKYAGHTVRMSGYVKTENVSGRIEPVIFPYAGWNKLLAKDSMAGDYSLKGTRDWTPFSVTCRIPDNTEYLDTGFNFFGSGKVWIDTNSIKLEIIK